MGHYIISFSIYTMAMIGIICLALFVYKKFSINSLSMKRKGILKVEDALGLSPRKTLYIVSAGNEKFLIAADLERTTLISKLNSDNSEVNELNEIDKVNLSSQDISC